MLPLHIHKWAERHNVGITVWPDCESVKYVALNRDGDITAADTIEAACIRLAYILNVEPPVYEEEELQPETREHVAIQFPAYIVHPEFCSAIEKERNELRQRMRIVKMLATTPRGERALDRILEIAAKEGL